MSADAGRPLVAEVTDPVCGMTFDESSAIELGACMSEHEGRRFWFCCPSCQAEFRADPAKFAG